MIAKWPRGGVQVGAPYMRPLVLAGHDREVTAVAWCPSDPHRIATCGDDATVKLWNLQRQWPPPQGLTHQALPSAHITLLTTYISIFSLSTYQNALSAHCLQVTLLTLLTPHYL